MSNLKDVPKKIHLLRTALNLFKKHDFSIGVDTIIKKSEVAKMTFYYNYDSKEYLINECLKYELDSQKKLINDNIDHDYLGIHNLKTIFFLHLDFISNNNINGSLFAKAKISLIENEDILETVNAYCDWKVKLIENQLSLINENTARVKADIFFNFLEGLQVGYKLENNHENIWLCFEKIFLNN